MSKQAFGMIGLGVMGQNFALNVERNGYGVAVYNIHSERTKQFLVTKAEGKNVKGADTLQEFVELLETPRRIMLLIPAGKPVDDMI
ncbi:MAG: NADP-dependent phosphogluconate dehydrogenase, partial [Methanobacteriota archaeon]